VEDCLFCNGRIRSIPGKDAGFQAEFIGSPVQVFIGLAHNRQI